MQTRRPPDPKTRYLVAAHLTLEELREGSHLTAEDLAEVGALEPGKTMHIGVGAPRFTLTRLAEPSSGNSMK